MTLGSDEQDLIKALNNVTDSSSTDATVASDGTNQAAQGAADSPFPPLFPDPLAVNQVSPSDPVNMPPVPAPIPPNNEALIGDNVAPTLSPYGIVSPIAPETMTPSPVDSSEPSPTINFDPIPVTPADLPEPVIPSDANAISSGNPEAVSTDVPAPIVDPTSGEEVTVSETTDTTDTTDTAAPDTSTEDTETTSPESEKTDDAPQTEDSGPLALIKKDVLVELRPLVDKLNVSPEDKFDTLLLLIRSTDDSSLVEPAHEAAKAIADESRRAEALLEIVKEIDYLTNKK